MLRVVLFLSLAATMVVAAWVPIGPDGGNVAALAVSPSAPATLVSVLFSTDTVMPVYRTTDGGAGWECTGGLPYMTAALIDPFDSLIVYATDGGGTIRRSTDGGATWQSVFVSFGGMAFGCDPFVPGRVYAAGGIYDTIAIPMFGVSTDHGATWDSLPVANDTGYIYALDASPVDSGVIWLGGDYGMIYRSTDGGATWEPRSNGLTPDNYVLAISASHADTGVVCAGTMNGLFRTTNAGGSWTQTSGPQYVTSVDLSPADPAKGYAYGYDSAPACYSTADAGVSWQPTSPIMPSASSGGIIADPALGDGVWCPTAAGVMHSTNRGAIWCATNTGIRSVTITTMSVPSWARERAYIAVEGVGVHRSSDAGQTWERCADFLACGNICGIGLTQGTGGDRLYALEGSG